MELNLIDYIILAIVILSILAGLQQGFIKALTGMVSTLLAVLIGFAMYDECIMYLNEYFSVSTRLADILRDKFPLTVLSIDTPLINLPFAIDLLSFKDAAESLAYFIMVIVSFLLVFFTCLIVLSLLAHLLEGIFSWGILSWINGVLGMILVPTKNLLIIMVLIGMIFPVVELAAQMGLAAAIIASDLISHSLISGTLLSVFEIIKALIIV